MNRLLSIAALALPLLSACGEKEEQPYFQVLGEASIEKDAEVFQISFALDERSKDRAESLAAASKRLKEIKDRMARLEGLERLRIETGEAKIEAVRPQGCDPDYGNNPYPDNCEPVAHITSFIGTVQGKPAGAAGPALSMLSELGVETVSTARFDVMDREAAELEARRAALRDAAATARALAEETGARVGAPVEVRYGEPRYGEQVQLGELPDSIRGTSKLFHSMAPRQALELPPAKVRLNAKVAVKFALEEPKAGGGGAN